MLQDLVCRGLREGEYMFRRVVFLLVDPTALDAYCIDQQRDHRERHLDFGRSVGAFVGIFGHGRHRWC